MTYTMGANTRGHSNAAFSTWGHIPAPLRVQSTERNEEAEKNSWEEPTKLIRQKARRMIQLPQHYRAALTPARSVLLWSSVHFLPPVARSGGTAFKELKARKQIECAPKGSFLISLSTACLGLDSQWIQIAEITNKPSAAKISQMNDSCLKRTLAPAQSYFCLSMIDSANLPAIFFLCRRSQMSWRVRSAERFQHWDKAMHTAPGPRAKWLTGTRGRSETK